METLELRCLLSATGSVDPALVGGSSTAGVPGYAPAQILQAYGFNSAATTNGLSTAGGDGSGQTIALVEAFNSATLASDLAHFDLHFKIADPPSLLQLNEVGGTALPSANVEWSQETALDVEWAHAVAPGANIVIVEAATDQIGDLLKAVDTARNLPDVSVVSMSWGIDEFAGETAYDSLFTTPAGHQSITFVAASGDTTVSTGVQWPAASPDVVSVGGTTLITTTNTAGLSSVAETPLASAVSGISEFENQPAYQSGLNTVSRRTTPDVTYNANPNPGFAVYNTNNGGWQTLGGTSAGAPQWAALIAIANQVRADAGGTTLDGVSQTLPGLYNYYSTTSKSMATVPVTTQGSAPMTFSVVTTGSLLNSGQGQAANVIGSLASTKTDPGEIAKSTVPAGKPPIIPVGNPVLSKRVHAFYMMPALRSGPVFNTVAARAHENVHEVLSQGIPLTNAASAGPKTATSAGQKTLSHMNFLEAAAFSESAIAAIPRFDLTEAIAAMYREIASPGAVGVVPVDASSGLQVEAHGKWYIARLDVAATFGDGLAAFINECAARPLSPVVADPHSSGHLRSWTVTGTVIAIDGIILGYLVSRRNRPLKSFRYVQWWKETTQPAY